MTLTVFPTADRRRTDWKNGGGTTSQVAGAPEGAGMEDFDWRISVADVTSGGPFSTFAGVDRVIVLLDGESMELHVDDARHRLLPHRPFAFAGEATTVCTLPAGPTRDLNVMTRRARFRAAVEVRALTIGSPATVDGGDPLILVTLSGSVDVSTPDGAHAHLGPLDAAATADPAVVTVAGEGSVAVARLTRLA
jgi:environmental stress-induced protein Ves